MSPCFILYYFKINMKFKLHEQDKMVMSDSSSGSSDNSDDNETMSAVSTRIRKQTAQNEQDEDDRDESPGQFDLIIISEQTVEKNRE